jgi:hypothetical protein
VHTALISGATLTVRRGELSTSFGHLQVPLRVVNGVYFGGESEDCAKVVFILEDSMHRLVMDCGSRAIGSSQLAQSSLPRLAADVTAASEDLASNVRLMVRRSRSFVADAYCPCRSHFKLWQGRADGTWFRDSSQCARICYKFSALINLGQWCALLSSRNRRLQTLALLSVT